MRFTSANFYQILVISCFILNVIHKHRCKSFQSLLLQLQEYNKITNPYNIVMWNSSLCHFRIVKSVISIYMLFSSTSDKITWVLKIIYLSHVFKTAQKVKTKKEIFFNQIWTFFSDLIVLYFITNAINPKTICTTVLIMNLHTFAVLICYSFLWN